MTSLTEALAGCGRKPLVKHHVDQNPGYRNIKPHGICPACHPLVPLKPLTQGRDNGKYYQWHDKDSQRYMGKENRQVKRFWPTRMRKARHRVPIVINQVTGQEHRRHHDRCDHAPNMRPFITLFDKYQARNDKAGRQGIECCINSWKVTQGHGLFRQIFWQHPAFH